MYSPSLPVSMLNAVSISRSSARGREVGNEMTLTWLARLGERDEGGRGVVRMREKAGWTCSLWPQNWTILAPAKVAHGWHRWKGTCKLGRYHRVFPLGVIDSPSILFLQPPTLKTVIFERKDLFSIALETRALRAHTPRAPCNCVIVQLGHMLSPTITYARTRPSRAHEQKLHA